MKSYAVIGLGRFGTRIAGRLYDYGEEVIAIDTNQARVDEIADHVTRAVRADAKDKDVLKSLGVDRCDVGIVAMASDLSASVLVTMTLKNLGVPHVICKAHDDTHREILEKLGADEVVIPERMVADRLARTMTSPNILEYIDLSESDGIIECRVPAPWVGKSLRELNIRAKFGVNIIAVRTRNGVTVSPLADFRPAAEDTLMLLGAYAALDKIKRIK